MFCVQMRRQPWCVCLRSAAGAAPVRAPPLMGACLECVQVQALAVVKEENERLEATNSVLEQQLSSSSPNTSVSASLHSFSFFS